VARISVIIPAYQSEATVAAALDSLLAQTRPADEILIVDSSPNEATAQALAPYLPRVTLIRPGARMYPHQARNLAAARAKGDLLVFTDPDIVAQPDWLARIAEAWREPADVVVGAIDCHGRRWMDVGVHLCKFDNWLPGGPPRTVMIGPSISLALGRLVFEQVGGFPPDRMLGDTTLSWRLRECGYALRFAPAAVLSHHHAQSLYGLVRERFSRGREFGRVRIVRGDWSMAQIGLWLLISLLPLRLAKLMLRRVLNAARAGWLGWFALTWPVVLLGEIGWLVGESTAYVTALRSRWRTRRRVE